MSTHEDLPPYAGRTVAVVGAGGYLGAALAAALAGTQARLLLVGRRQFAAPPHAEVRISDACEPDPWREIAARADVVFCVSGNTSVAAATADPAACLTSTLLPLTHLFAAARAAQRVPRVVYASTARVYGSTAALPIGEETDTDPATPFGLHSVLAEQFLQLASSQGALDAVSLRLGNIYGISPCSAGNDRNVLTRMAQLAVQGADLTLYGDGNYLRDYVHLDDVVRAFLLVAATPGLAGQCLNAASGCGITVHDVFTLIAQRAEAATGRPSHVREVPWPQGETSLECRDFAADIRRIASACGWRPEVTFVDGIDRLIASIVSTAARAQ